MKKLIHSFAIIFCCLIIACSSDETAQNNTPENPLATLNLPDNYFNYASIELPAHYTTNAFPPQAQFQHAATEFDNTPANNPITNAGATLGRVIFYDKKLSANGTISCASCHKAEHGFSDSAILSEGFNGELTRRHAMGIVNARFYFSGKFFWDERAATLEEQVLMPFQDEVEMGLTLNELVSIMNAQEYYKPLFQAAFNEETITTNRIAKALAQFIRSLVSTTAKYDVARSEVNHPMVNFPAFTAEENLGKNLFFTPQPLTNGEMATCAGCHVSEAFVGPIPNGPFGTTTATTNGLDATSTTDLGINETTGNPNDIGKFKAPSLRNIAVRPPYMHDGRFASLEDVLEHYSSGIQNHANLMPPFISVNNEVGTFNFSEEQKYAIIAFLETLTDEDMLSDEKFSNPFIED